MVFHPGTDSLRCDGQTPIVSGIHPTCIVSGIHPSCLLERSVLPLNVWIGLGMVRGTEGHLGLQFFPQVFPELSNELQPSVTVNDLG